MSLPSSCSTKQCHRQRLHRGGPDSWHRVDQSCQSISSGAAYCRHQIQLATPGATACTCHTPATGLVRLSSKAATSFCRQKPPESIPKQSCWDDSVVMSWLRSTTARPMTLPGETGTRTVARQQGCCPFMAMPHRKCRLCFSSIADASLPIMTVVWRD